MDAWVQNIGTELVLFEAYANLKLGQDSIEIRKRLENLNEDKIEEAGEFYIDLASQIDQMLNQAEVISQEEP